MFFINARFIGAVIHSHESNCVIAVALCDAIHKGSSPAFKIRNQEMIKGITGHGYIDELVIPIIDNVPIESELANSLERAIITFPNSCAVLVRHHGIYVWGADWQAAKRHAGALY